MSIPAVYYDGWELYDRWYHFALVPFSREEWISNHGDYPAAYPSIPSGPVEVNIWGYTTYCLLQFKRIVAVTFIHFLEYVLYYNAYFMDIFVS